MFELIWPVLPYLFFMMVVIALAETLLSAGWSPRYFSSGIPIYRQVYTVDLGVVWDSTASKIEAAIPSSGWWQPMLVRKIGQNRIAFREKMLHFGMAYTPIMHGCILYEPQKRQITISGYANWYAIVFPLYMGVFFLSMPVAGVDLLFPFIMVLIMSSIYITQRKRFVQVEQTVLKLYKHAPSLTMVS